MLKKWWDGSPLFLKPNKGTVGEGVLKLDKVEDGVWQASYRLGKKMVRLPLQENLLYSKLKKIGAGNDLFKKRFPWQPIKGLLLTLGFLYKGMVRENGE